MDRFLLGENRGAGTPCASFDGEQAVIQMLECLEADMRHRPERLRPLSLALINHITLLVGHLDVDMSAPLLADDE